MQDLSARTFGEQEFKGARLGNALRTRRAIVNAQHFAQNPAASIPAAFADPHQSKAAYRFLSNPKVKHEAILSGHFEQTALRCQPREVVLLIQDISSLTFSRSGKRKDLGPLHATYPVQGLKVQTVLAVDAQSHEVLGSLAQKLWARSRRKKKDRKSSRRRKKRSRESEYWSECALMAGKVLGETLGDRKPRLIHVFDREGDVYEELVKLRDNGHSFVVRASQNRALDEDEGPSYLLDTAREAPVRGTQLVQVPQREAQPAREAVVELRATTVRVKRPASSTATDAELDVNVVALTEKGPPRGCKPVEWILLTLEPIRTMAHLRAIVRIYEARWLIEEFHMGLKTGCACEERQLETAHALKNFMGFATVIAWRLLALRALARKQGEEKAAEVLPPKTFHALQVKRPKLKQDCTVKEATRAIAMLGGFMGRNSDGEPGWRTLWKGFQLVLEAERTISAAALKPG